MLFIKTDDMSDVFGPLILIYIVFATVGIMISAAYFILKKGVESIGLIATVCVAAIVYFGIQIADMIYRIPGKLTIQEIYTLSMGTEAMLQIEACLLIAIIFIVVHRKYDVFIL